MNPHDQACRESSPSILVVDDTLANLRLLFQILNGNGYQVRTVSSGERALESVRDSHPDLILLDIIMPNMDGYEVAHRLRANPQTQDIPIIFISALEDVRTKINAFKAGGVDYITKPFQVEEVLARIKTHLALRCYAANLEKQNAELDAFAHTVAHDLKNPLTILIGTGSALDELLDTWAMPQARECVRLMLQSARKMNSIIEELLLLSSVRSMERIEVEPLDTFRCIQEAQKHLLHLTAAYQPEIIHPETWPEAVGYAPWIEEVWVNYISNAIKYGGQPPRIKLGSEACLPQTQARPMVRFWVRDNGAGLSAEQQAALFTPFEQLHQVRAQGHGLGLSIVKRIVERLGGQVGVESEPGQGSCFYFTLPVKTEQ